MIQTHLSRASAKRRGVTLIESVAAMVILAGAMAAAMNTVASARASQVMAAERAKARVLAETMLAEVLDQPYAEPGSSTLGPDAGESAANTRNQYDDVDDYHGWTNTIRQPDGTPIPGFDGYEVSFAVAWIDPTKPWEVESSDKGAKRIEITVSRQGRQVTQLVAWVAAP